MKLRSLGNIGTLLFFISIFYVLKLFDSRYETQHPTLNDESKDPILYLNNVRRYTRESDDNRSMYHLDKAIQSIEYLETDVDLNTSKIVDEAVEKLKYIYEEIRKDTLITDDMNHAFEFALTSLSLAELRVSERYAESNQLELSRVALKYTKLHLKNALEYASNNNATQFEKHVFHEVDSLLANYENAPVLITAQIDHLINEMDSLLQLEKSNLKTLGSHL